jgi:hypothetical protein
MIASTRLIEARLRARVLCEIRRGGARGTGRAWLQGMARKDVLQPLLDRLVDDGLVVSRTVLGYEGRPPAAVIYIAVEFIAGGGQEP